MAVVKQSSGGPCWFRKCDGRYEEEMLATLKKIIGHGCYKLCDHHLMLMLDKNSKIDKRDRKHLQLVHAKEHDGEN